mmetsp:Transcript_29176/g.21721  ORF Transcript_29176/g.21721 Transcript_29176/m.21721 type:complete len:293 (+) Transcript_29176:46-924(+)|eukprot:CAMPEP_0202966768 /NCGR_PEP_ID=MMETSP1396-20130829/11319_1 /ASSEMBLY_ACC=CAM_ASM_000872 /TAXON_ID= /ORGANISM="Pseudokeronopsis sp., Strain Brazil" /LENGTH=292 /DNA_ID=CAMNT_0049691003 /DNA_START=41 /DNA_END=919 /DNA_ORIENTATION=-
MAARRFRQQQATKNDDDLASMVQSGPQGAYEALQLYRSRSIRLKNKSDIEGAMKSCTSGTVLLLENGYENAAAELADFLLELFAETGQPVGNETRGMLFTIADKFQSGSAHKVEFLKAAIKWSAEVGSREGGDSALHTKLAECLWDTRDKNAANHFAQGEAPGLYNEKIFATFAGSSENEAREQACTIGIVNFLALENLRDAFELFRLYNAAAKEKGFPVSSSLLTFCDYLLQVSRRDAQPLFKQLVNEYASVVDFDEQVTTLLMGPIAAKLFGIKPKINPMMSMLHSMMSS